MPESNSESHGQMVKTLTVANYVQKIIFDFYYSGKMATSGTVDNAIKCAFTCNLFCRNLLVAGSS